MKFKSAVDNWYYALALGMPVVVLAIVFATVDSKDPMVLLALAGSLLIALGLPIWLLFTTEYEVHDDTLTVRSGPITRRVSLAEIESVQASRSMLSAPALSLKRLKLRLRSGKSLLISPRDEAGFLKAIGQQLTK